MLKQMNTLLPRNGNGWLRLLSWASLVILAVLLLTEHTEHLLSALPYLLLLACPLMHLFLHRHGHSESHHSKSSSTPPHESGTAKMA